MSRAPRVVLDTNVVLSALVFAHGRLAAVRNAWHAGVCSPLVSRVTAAELVQTLAYPKFRLGPGEQRELLADYLPYCTTVRMPAKPPKTPTCRDPADVPFLQLALAGKAARLKESAEKNRRSLNSEILTRLERDVAAPKVDRAKLARELKAFTNQLPYVDHRIGDRYKRKGLK